MCRWFCGFLALWGVCALPALAHAQVRIGNYQRPQVNPNPAFSPYLNLARGTAGTAAGTAIDYYGIVRPQIDFRNNFQTLQQQVQGIQAQQATSTTETDAALPTTGRTIGGFQNYSHFFPLMTQGSGSGRPVASGTPGQR